MRTTVLAPVGYPWEFNGPRFSRNHILRSKFLPLNKINYRIEGVTAFPPTARRVDLCHAFNRIPFGQRRFIVGFESHLPRAFTWEQTSYFAYLRRRLAGDKCLGIFPISQNALRTFASVHQDRTEWDELSAKTQVRYPNVVVPDQPDGFDGATDQVRVTFIGSHLARKGGLVAVRLAELAAAEGFPLEVTIVSSLRMGAGIWTDPQQPAYFEDWLKRLDRPNIRLLKGADNATVLALLQRSHFSLLTTFGDTFGFSAIEAMANYCPVIATSQGALPEFIDATNGILLDLDTNDIGEWVFAAHPGRNTDAFERLFTDEVERLAIEAYARLKTVWSSQVAYRRLRANARATAVKMFDARRASDLWDATYESALASIRAPKVRLNYAG